MATPPIQTGDPQPKPKNLLEEFEIFRKSRSISGPDPRQQRTPLHPPDPTPTREYPQGRPQAFRPEGQPEFGRSFTMPAGPPEEQKLITPKLPEGYSPRMTVGGRVGRFNFNSPSITDAGTPGTRYVFETEAGGGDSSAFWSG